MHRGNGPRLRGLHSTNERRGTAVLDPTRGPSVFSRSLRERLPRLASSRLSILIEGESGLGRSVLAERLHHTSPRAAAPFHSFDCVSVPEPLLPRELFGHRRGAFTGAEEADGGRLRATEGGTFYLHGIEHLPATGQGALLRVLEQGEIQPLGSPHPEPIDVRFIESTTRPLASQVAEGSFRTDLFYRLNGLQIRIPPLRERPEDLHFAIDDLIAHHATQLGRPAPRLRDDLRRLLVRDPWPGNTVELGSVIEGMLAMSSDDLLTPHDLPPAVLERIEERGETTVGTRTFSIPAGLGFRDQVVAFQRILIQRVWRECGRDRKKLAARLHLEPHQLRYWSRKLDLPLDEDSSRR